jgi:DNA-directed RNA polymerase III subunit RPC3
LLTYIKPDLVIRINYEKCTVALRNLRLVELANNRIGETTSHVYAELLRLLEESIPRCRPDPRIDNLDDLPDGPTITTMELAAAMSPSINVAAGIGKAPSDKINTSKLLKAQKSARRRSRGDSEADVEGEASADEDESDEDGHEINGNGNLPEVDQDSDSHGEDPFEDDAVTRAPKRAKVTFQDKLPKPPESEDRQNVMVQIKNHLLLLAADEYHFLRRCGGRGLGEWTVDFERVIDILQRSELDSIVLENFGTTGHRLARMMRATGKMDEKQLSTMALMKQKDVRTKLAEMQMAGMADIQEVPKDATRSNNRTIFLWHFDSARVASVILRYVYKTMSRCFQRLEVEKRRASGILSLIERSDVKDNIGALSGEQLNMLHDIRGKEDKLLGQIGRLDELVGTFRDY